MIWQEPSQVKASDVLRTAVGGHPLVADILARRGFKSEEDALRFIDPSKYTPTPPTELDDLAVAAKRLKKAIEKHERILVWGDFDVDGQTSTSLYVAALKALEADVVYHIPDRMKEGHGVQPDILKQKIEEHKPHVILTCDVGIRAHEAVKVTDEAGIDMLITDHHALPPELPKAMAVVDPQRSPKSHPLRDLPGVGVSYKLIQHLYKLTGHEHKAEEFLDLVALGIVADVATQQRDTRYLLQLGIDRLRTTKRVGLEALIISAQINQQNLSAETIGFQIGPRLNALGRLGDANEAVRMLTTDNELVASTIAAQLEVLNNKRKQIEDQIYTAAQEQISRDASLLNYEALVLYNEKWHPGVIGIVASRLVERYGKPTILLTDGGLTDDKKRRARGSARSVAGVDIGASIAAEEEMLFSHGGHPGAAGLALEEARIPEFRQRLSVTIARTRDKTHRDMHHVDAELSLDDLTMELAEEINRIAPFGAGNPPVQVMISNVQRVSHAPFGSGKKHIRIMVEDSSGVRRELVWWRGSDYSVPTYPFDLLLIPRINDYKGKQSLQLEWIDSRPATGAIIEAGPKYYISDCRSATEDRVALPTLESITWVEGAASEEKLPLGDTEKISRIDPLAHDRLVIWTPPPGPQELEDVLAMTGAKDIFVVAEEPKETTPEVFAKRMAGLVKYALKHYEGKATLLQFAVATAQREVTVRRALELMQAQGKVSIEWLPGGNVLITKGGKNDMDKAALIEDDLKALLSEAAAYRAYFQTSELERFFQ